MGNGRFKHKLFFQYLTFRFLLTVNVFYCCLLSFLSRVRLFATPWTVARQTPLSMGFSSQEYWSGLPFHAPPPPRTSSQPRGWNCVSCIAGVFFTTEPLGQAKKNMKHFTILHVVFAKSQQLLNGSPGYKMNITFHKALPYTPYLRLWNDLSCGNFLTIVSDPNFKS